MPPLLPQPSTHLTRRQLLATGSLLWTGLSTRPNWAFDAAPPTADRLIPGKHPGLIVYKADPFEIETPFELLRAQRHTPTEAIFVRNNAQPSWSSTLAPAEQPHWKIECVGLLEYPRTIALAELRELPQIEQELVLQCSGNGRAMYSQLSPVKGSPWAHGAMANVTFRGVPLRAIFDKFAIRPHAAARFVAAEGFDAPAKSTTADFEHSLPLSDLLERSFLALELNGRPLPAVHGGPVRLITPGYYGTMHVKWLSRLRFEAQESVNHHHTKRYRNAYRQLPLGEAFEYTHDNSEPHWNMRIKSVVFGPTSGETLRTNRLLAQGVAWNDGQARIDAVEVSLDRGQTWRRAELDRPKSAYAWHAWQLPLTLAPGEHTLACRAVDTRGRTQPLDATADWNPDGYCWRGVDRVTFRVEG